MQPTTPTAPLSVDCSRGTTACPVITIAGDAVASTATFSGFADPSLRADPTVANQLWMAYSYLEGKPATGQGGIAVGVPVVSTHLARSIDGGASWRLDSKVWQSALVSDPENRGPASYFGSETPSLAVKSVAGQITWYSVRLSYFLEPVSAYSPRYASSWTMRVAAAAGPTPAALASAPETVLGTASTSAAYNVNVRLTALSPLLSGCAFWNNLPKPACRSRLQTAPLCFVLTETTPLRRGSSSAPSTCTACLRRSPSTRAARTLQPSRAFRPTPARISNYASRSTSTTSSRKTTGPSRGSCGR